jgi:phytanoyl-CoA hydroxylase
MFSDVKEKYSRDGYLVLNDFFPKERMFELKNEIKEIFTSGEDMKCRIEVDQKKLKEQGVFIGVARINSIFKELVYEEKLISLLKELLGNKVHFTDDKVVFKNSDTDFGSPWHQDWYYWKGSHKVSVWIALDDVNIENGCLKVVPGSHKDRFNHEDLREDGFSKSVLPDYIKTDQVKSLPVNRGSIIILDDLTLHASHPNTSGEDRWAFIPTYTDVNWNLNHLLQGKLSSPTTK